MNAAGGKALTAAVAAAGVQGVVRSAATAVASGDGEAQLPTLAIVVHAVIEAILTGGVEHQDVHDEVQVTLDEGAVPPAGLVSPFNAMQVPVSPVDVIAVLSQAKGVRQIVGYHHTLLTCVGTQHAGQQESYQADELRELLGESVNLDLQDSQPSGEACVWLHEADWLPTYVASPPGVLRRNLYINQKILTGELSVDSTFVYSTSISILKHRKA